MIRGYDKLALDYGMLLDLRFMEGVGLVTRDEAKPHHKITLVGAPAWTQTANNITVPYFDGAGDYMECVAADTPDLNFTTGDYSIACWVYPIDTSSSMMIAGKYLLDSVGWELYLFALLADGYLTLRHHHASLAPDNRDGCYSTDWREKVWQLMVVTRSGLYPLHYRNAIPLTMSYEVGGVKNPDSAIARDLVIGTRFSKDQNWHKGNMWGLRIWNRALSPADVQLLFEMEHRFFEV